MQNEKPSTGPRPAQSTEKPARKYDPETGKYLDEKGVSKPEPEKEPA